MSLHFRVEQRHPALERLICAAVSNDRFATQLVAAPETALRHSEHGRQLSPAEWAMVTSIDDATDIYEFAARLHARVQKPH